MLACAGAMGGCSVSEKMPPFGTPTSDADSGSFGTEQGGREAETGSRETALPDSSLAENTPTWDLKAAQEHLGHQAPDRLTLEEAWRLAVEHDPLLQAAGSQRAASQTEIRIGRAALLPQVQAGYSRSKITGLQRNFTAVGTSEADLDYDSTSAYIQLRQPLFNVSRYAQFQRGKARAQLGEAEFALQQYEAAMRLVTSYLDVVAAEGRLALNQALAHSLEEQAVTQEALFELNEADRVDAQETRARLAIAQADVIQSEDEVRVARRQLQALVGEETREVLKVDTLDTSELSIDASLIALLQRANVNSAPIRVAEARLREADTEVLQAGGRHLPTADLVLALADADSENLDSLSQRSNTFQAGVQVAIPIFSGGYNTANHARTRHVRQQAEHELAQAREQVAAEVTRQYTAVQNGAQRIAALSSSVAAGEESLHAAREGYQYGVNSNLDVLRRQDSLYEARFQLLEARVEWLQARIALAAAVGEPLTAVFMELASKLDAGVDSRGDR